jgi:hypothetical protein
MSTKSTSVRARPIHHSEDTADRIRAYLASVRPLRGVEFEDTPYQRGRSLIEQLALSADGTEQPTLRLSTLECADVVFFVAKSEPIQDRNWWLEPTDAPSHLVGLKFVLGAVEASLRDKGKRQ